MKGRHSHGFATVSVEVHGNAIIQIRISTSISSIMRYTTSRIMIFRVTSAMTNIPKYKSLYTAGIYRLIPVITKIIYAPVCSGRDVIPAGSVSAFSIFFIFVLVTLSKHL